MIAGGYLLLTAGLLAYELSVRLTDRGNSEFAGMLSTAATLPSSLVFIIAGRAAFGVRPGDSDVAFVTILGLSVLANAGLLWALVRFVSRRSR